MSQNNKPQTWDEINAERAKQRNLWEWQDLVDQQSILEFNPIAFKDGFKFASDHIYAHPRVVELLNSLSDIQNAYGTPDDDDFITTTARDALEKFNNGGLSE